MLNKVN